MYSHFNWMELTFSNATYEAAANCNCCLLKYQIVSAKANFKEKAFLLYTQNFDICHNVVVVDIIFLDL